MTVCQKWNKTNIQGLCGEKCFKQMLPLSPSTTFSYLLNILKDGVLFWVAQVAGKFELGRREATPHISEVNPWANSVKIPRAQRCRFPALPPHPYYSHPSLIELEPLGKGPRNLYFYEHFCDFYEQ